jgi:pimeloyl-ACP methyl ester carboxylesterase
MAQQGWLLWQAGRRDVRQTLATKTNRVKKGRLFEDRQETTQFTRTYTIEDGIERVRYLPKTRRFETPLLFQHGMWQGAWSWRLWQELFAEWGWENQAYSLPGHAGSPEQRSPALATVDYYLGFLQAEVNRLSRRPVLIGHSMGGGLVQWYLKYVGDLPAVVLVGSMPSHSAFEFGKALLEHLKLDPVGMLLTLLTWQPAFARNPKQAARLLLSENACYSPETFFARLSPDSLLVLYQHNPPFWQPPEQVDTPILWLTGDRDKAVSVAAQRRSAAYYQADYQIIPEAGHNLMMEHNYRQTAEIIHHWLVAQEIE